jgi:hypothetical protein
MRRLGIFLALAVLTVTISSPAAAGSMNCGEALACLLSCPANDSQCAFDCGLDLHTNAENLYAELLLCLAPLCPGNPPDTVCLLQAGAGSCQSEYKFCVDDAGCLGTCEGKECGDDGCGADCGDCPPGMACETGTCIMCQPDCVNKQCGDNGCGSSCGNCPEGQGCIENQCIACNPNCAGKECGEDGCGGICGQCGFTSECINGLCVGCTPNCAGKECGDNGCGGMCGACQPEYKCDTGICVEDIPCNPNCLNKECGDDGCGGSCGACGPDQFCAGTGLCTVGSAPDIVDQDLGNDNESPTGDDGYNPNPGQEVTTPVGSQCPPGYKLFFGECVVDNAAAKKEDSGGCTATEAGCSPSLLLLLALSLLFWRLTQKPRYPSV